MPPPTRYADYDGARIAYQRFGQGPPTVISSAGSFSNTDVLWEDPSAAMFLSRFGTFAEMVRFDRPGTSNSDPFPRGVDPGLSADVDALGAIVDELDVDRVCIWAMLDAGPIAIRYTAAHPERVEKLILYNTTARFRMAEDYPHGVPDDVVDMLLEMFRASWGTDASPVALNVPSRVGDPTFTAWYAKYVRAIGTPTAMTHNLEQLLEYDVRGDLAAITVPTLVLHRARYALIGTAHGRYLAEHLPDATYRELPGADGPIFWEAQDEILDVVRSFLVGDRRPGGNATTIASVLFTDIVDSTRRVGEIGDREWGALLAVHHDTARGVVARFGGTLVKSTGDGILATFADPAAAISAARTLVGALADTGVAIRSGVHTGTVETTGDDIGGIAVHIAARVMGAGPPGAVTVSRTVRDLLLGSGEHFTSLGSFELRGVEGSWELYTVD
jgi:class 3 adenylate cyclase